MKRLPSWRKMTDADDNSRRERREAMLEEYRGLWTEINMSYGRRAVMQGIAVAIVAGLLGASWQFEAPELAGAATFIMVAFLHDDVKWRFHIVVMSHYIGKTIEPEVNGLGWFGKWPEHVKSIRSFRPRVLLTSKIPASKKVIDGLGFCSERLLMSRYSATIFVGVAVHAYLALQKCGDARRWLNISFSAFNLLLFVYVLAKAWGEEDLRKEYDETFKSNKDTMKKFE